MRMQVEAARGVRYFSGWLAYSISPKAGDCRQREHYSCVVFRCKIIDEGGSCNY